MTCPKCRSIWLRPEAPWVLDEPTGHHTRTVRCGSCGSLFLLRAIFVEQGLSDIEMFRKLHESPVAK